MDVEPIYCAEQIVVPVDLADVLKAYTKEVIRRQPENLIEFSAKYFQNLANVASSAQEATAPSKDQLKLFCERAGSGSLTAEQVQALAGQVGIAKSIVGKVLAVGKFDGLVDTDKFLFLLLVMSCESFAAVIQGVFFVFGQELASDRFQALISYLAPDMDPDITSQFLSDLSMQLQEVPSVTYESVVALPIIQTKL
uniref:RIIa domain-containing protein n=1 Tax=Chlamydomonas leiostraca TaxID=1034604 RepID=A0A7S0RQE9_9CHLO